MIWYDLYVFRKSSLKYNLIYIMKLAFYELKKSKLKNSKYLTEQCMRPTKTQTVSSWY